MDCAPGPEAPAAGRDRSIPRIRIIGGGLAGLAAAAALGSLNLEVDVYEARPFLGGRATSYPLRPDDPYSDRVDNCQHVLLRCCKNLLDFYRRCGVSDQIEFHRELYFVRPGGKTDVFRADPLPAPLHLARSLMSFSALPFGARIHVARTLNALKRSHNLADLDRITMGEWLDSRNTPEIAIERFWRPILVSALNEEPRFASAKAAFQVFAEGMMGSRRSYEMGVPAVPLADLYSAALEKKLGPGVHVHLRRLIEKVDTNGKYDPLTIVAVPFERVNELVPGLDLPLERFEHSPITGIHLWFDRPITKLPHAVLLDRTIQWLFRKGENYIQVVVSASRDLIPMSRAEVAGLAVRELKEFFPKAAKANLLRTHVVKEARATFSVAPELEKDRPKAATKFPRIFLAGDWTDTGWPATMEGAVRSGYRAAEAVAAAMNVRAKFVID